MGSKHHHWLISGSNTQYGIVEADLNYNQHHIKHYMQAAQWNAIVQITPESTSSAQSSLYCLTSTGYDSHTAGYLRIEYSVEVRASVLTVRNFLILSFFNITV